MKIKDNLFSRWMISYLLKVITKSKVVTKYIDIDYNEEDGVSTIIVSGVFETRSEKMIEMLEKLTERK